MNYQQELEKIIDECKKRDEVKHLLIHSCCAPCSTYVLEYLTQYFDITILYYNPNIWPEAEYDKRVKEQEMLITKANKVHRMEFVAKTYDGPVFYEVIRGLEQEREGGARCAKCFELRLRQSAKLAKELNADYYTTTLTISPMKNAKVLNEIGTTIGTEVGVTYLLSDFKKKNGYKRSVELSKEYGLYRQDYCGCVFSKNEREINMKNMEERE